MLPKNERSQVEASHVIWLSQASGLGSSRLRVTAEWLGTSFKEGFEKFIRACVSNAISPAFPYPTLLSETPFPLTPEQGCTDSAVLIFLVIKGINKRATRLAK